MADKTLFKSLIGKLMPATDALNPPQRKQAEWIENRLKGGTPN